MATRSQSDATRQPLNGTWQQISGAFNFSYTSIAGFPRLLLHHDGSLYVLAGIGAILWLKPEYQINGGAWTDSGWGPDGGKFTFPAGWDGTISLQCNRPCFPTDYPAGTVINTRVMAKCSGSVVLCDSLLDPYPDVSKTWTQSESHQWNEAEDDIDGPIDVTLTIADWGAANLNTIPIKSPLFNSFAPVLPGNIVVQFSQGQSQSDKFESIVSSISIDNSSPPGLYTVVSAGTYQQWNDPGNLGGEMFEDSSFIWAGGNRVFCRFGNFANTFAWLVDPDTKSMSEITLPVDIFPSGYSRPMNCNRAYAVYSPSVDKVAMLYQQASGDLDMFVVSAKITDTGAIVDAIPSSPIWQQDVEYVNVESWIAGDAVGPLGKIVYAADLYNNSTYRCALLSADISGLTPVMGYDVTFAPVEAAHVVPVAIAGSKDVEEFVLFFADTNTSVFAAKFDSEGQQVGSVLTVDTGITVDRDRGKAVWLTGTNQIVFVFGSGSDGLLREYVLNSTALGIELAASNEYSGEYASSYCDIGESTSMLISSNLHKQFGLQPNVIRTRAITWE